jgi:CHAT domain-containing protein
MLAFYDELLKGNPPSIALSNAETKLRGIPNFQHPYFWSGFAIMQS